MESTFASMCSAHQIPVTMICLKSDCKDFLLCSSCDHQHSCPGDVIRLPALDELYAGMENLLGHYKEEYAESEQLIDACFERIKSVYVRKAELRADRLKRIFQKFSPFHNFERLVDELGDIMNQDESVSLDKLKSDLLPLLCKLKSFFYESNYSKLNRNDALEGHLKQYFKDFETQFNKHFAEIEDSQSSSFERQLNPVRLDRMRPFEHYHGHVANSGNVFVNSSDPTDAIPEARLEPQESQLVRHLNGLYMRRNFVEFTAACEEHFITKFNEGHRVFGIEQTELLQVSLHKRLFCFTGMVKQSMFFAKLSEQVATKGNRAIYVGRLASAASEADLGRVVVPKSKRLVRAFFVSGDDYLAVQFEDAAAIYQVAEEGRRVRLLVQESFEGQSMVWLKPFTGAKYDLMMVSPGKKISFLKIKQHKIQNYDLSVLEIFQIDEFSFFYIDQGLKLNYLNLHLQKSKCVKEFDKCIQKIFSIKISNSFLSKNIVKSNLVYKSKNKEMEKLIHFFENAGIKNSKNTNCPIKFLTFRVKQKFIFSISNFENLFLNCRTFCVDLPKNISSVKVYIAARLQISDVVGESALSSIFKFGSTWFNVSSFQESKEFYPISYQSDWSI